MLFEFDDASGCVGSIRIRLKTRRRNWQNKAA